jgi:hypothetical protein
MVRLRDVVCADGFLPLMLSPYGRDMYRKYENNIDSCNLEVCNYCKARIKGETLLDIPPEEGDNGSVSSVGGGGSKPSKKPRKQKRVKALAKEWSATLETIGWNSLVISNGEAHRVRSLTSH